ncbi:hypothetical protein DSCW_18050 [Desulfosarcina widdelii]|uniref:Uncharacterized protein n=1 Tax=Desulfosarcina widdelii TaxID=947919 RepID=A0A5K7Z0G7_9BACT|nr:DUF2612 domain-containing protein [Desulfosarcina widdelii]BBO74388.1 hypothetical protein DSCW_18050 [Desulfosarcina widdelii]
MIVPITTHTADAQARLLMQYRHSPNIAALIQALYGQPVQGVEDAVASLTGRLSIDDSEGAQLDGIGRIVGTPRAGWSDAIYRILLKARCGQLVSRGTLEDIISVWRIISQAETIRVVEVYPAQVDLYADEPIDGDISQFVYDLMQKVSAAGVEVNFLAIIFSPTNAFGFDPDDPTVNGFSDVDDPTSGGELAYIQMTSERVAISFKDTGGIAFKDTGGITFKDY